MHLWEKRSRRDVGFEFETVLLDVDGDLRDAVAIRDDPAALLARRRGGAR
jgi:hypothetical protein